jgi:hypothetical protein
MVKFAPLNEQISSLLHQDRQCTYNVSLRHLRATIVAVEKHYRTTCVCVRVCVYVALGVQHAIRVRLIVF